MKQVLKCNFLRITGCVILICALLISCSKTIDLGKNKDLQFYKSELCRFFDTNQYVYDIEEKSDKDLVIDLDNQGIYIILEVKSNNIYYSIHQINELNDLNEKYNIHYDLILKIAAVLKENQLNKKDIQAVVENEKDFYQTENDSNYIMHKEKSFGFYDLPRINYSIIYDSDENIYEEEICYAGTISQTNAGTL